MSLAKLHSRAQIGTTAPEVTIEVLLSGGLPAFSIVGLPETAVRESKDRVRGALISCGFRFPLEKITVALGPADMRKTGGRFDLAIALGILCASRQLPVEMLERIEFYGELGLNGELRRIPGVLPAAMRAEDAGRHIVVPSSNLCEATLVSDHVLPAGTLTEVTAHLNGSMPINVCRRQAPPAANALAPDIADVKGQQRACRALEIAAAGGHNLLFVGPPGTGKSMLAARLPGILPKMSEAEAIATATIESVLGVPPDLDKWRIRPFRSPHHTASAPALVGGGPLPRPGEVSRAHNGVLFLDELPEFNRNVLEVLREPLESGQISIVRASSQADYPASFQLIAAMNPCPCGYLGDDSGYCGCSAERVRSYREKISGPLLDRIDIQVEVGRPPRAVLRPAWPAGESSDEVRKRVDAARERQLARDGVCSARLDGARLDNSCGLDDGTRQLLEDAAERFSLSIRACLRVQRVARTIADLAGEDDIRKADLAEALTLRGFDPSRRDVAGRRVPTEIPRP